MGWKKGANTGSATTESYVDKAGKRCYSGTKYLKRTQILVWCLAVFVLRGLSLLVLGSLVLFNACSHPSSLFSIANLILKLS